MWLRGNHQAKLRIAAQVGGGDRVIAYVQIDALTAAHRQSGVREHNVHVRILTQHAAVNPRPLLFTRVDMPWPTGAEVHVDCGVARTGSQAYRRDTAHEVQMAPRAGIEVAARILQVSPEASVAVIRGTDQPRTEIQAGTRILSGRLDDKIAVQRVGKLVRHAHA